MFHPLRPFSTTASTLAAPKLLGYLLIGLSATIALFPSLISLGISGYLWSMTPEILAAFIAFPLYGLIAAAPPKALRTAALTLFAVIFCYPLVVMLYGVGMSRFPSCIIPRPCCAREKSFWGL